MRLRRGRQHAVQAKIHGSRGVVVRPIIGESDHRKGARPLFSAIQFDRVGELGIVYLSQRLGAEIERSPERDYELVLALILLEFGLRRMGITGFGTKIIVDSMMCITSAAKVICCGVGW